MRELRVRRWGAGVALVAVAGGVVSVADWSEDHLFGGPTSAVAGATGAGGAIPVAGGSGPAAYTISPAAVRRFTEAAPLIPAPPVLSAALQPGTLVVPALYSAVPAAASSAASGAAMSPTAPAPSYVLALDPAKPAWADGHAGPVGASTSLARSGGVATTPAVAAPARSGAETTISAVDVAARTSTAPAASTTPALGERFRAFAAGRPGHVSVAMYDAVAGTTVAWTDPAVAGYEMASTVKLDILTALVARAGASGQLTARERALARTMISVSDNGAASALWSDLGRGPAMQVFYRRLGMGSSTAGSGGTWGLTRTTAADQLAVLKAVAYPNGVVSDAGRAVISGLLKTVVPSQHWGLSGGVPAGVTVDLKNGWLPRSTGGWVIASLAHVHGAGRDYVMAVYTKNGPSMSSGITTVAGLSALAWAAAKVSPAAR